MATLTSKNIYFHELIGLQIIAENEHCSGNSRIKGKIVDETQNMIITFDGVKKKYIPKNVTTFRIVLPNNSIIVVEGKKIVGRPEDRIKMSRRKLQ